MPTPKLLDQVRTIIRVKHYSPKTERAYVSWIKRFIFFHNKQHPKDMVETETGEFIGTGIDAWSLKGLNRDQLLTNPFRVR